MPCHIDVDDLIHLRGTFLGRSPWHVIDQERIDRFADATDDHQWIHVDRVRAAAGPFGVPIAHGYLTLSLIPSLLWEVCRVDGAAMEINYGLEKVRFPAAVPAGASIRAEVELAEVTDTDPGRLARFAVRILSDAGVRPVCVADVLCLYQLRVNQG